MKIAVFLLWRKSNSLNLKPFGASRRVSVWPFWKCENWHGFFVSIFELPNFPVRIPKFQTLE
ncbi:MAG: hypothetical protein GY820_44265 [Gammaproteobacteria bacterium]|nr:hypothetical protein [Gammaproteobacteria bacterium]